MFGGRVPGLDVRERESIFCFVVCFPSSLPLLIPSLPSDMDENTVLVRERHVNIRRESDGIGEREQAGQWWSYHLCYLSCVLGSWGELCGRERPWARATKVLDSSSGSATSFYLELNLDHGIELSQPLIL